MKKNMPFEQNCISNKQYFSNKIAFLLILFSELVKMLIFRNWYNMPRYTDDLILTIFGILTFCELAILIWKITIIIKEKNPGFIWKLFGMTIGAGLIITLSIILFGIMSFKNLAG